jgi:hypothetical protein
VIFSTLGAGAATRAGTMIWFLWVAYLGVRLLAGGEMLTASSARTN